MGVTMSDQVLQKALRVAKRALKVIKDLAKCYYNVKIEETFTCRDYSCEPFHNIFWYVLGVYDFKVEDEIPKRKIYSGIIIFPKKIRRKLATKIYSKLVEHYQLILSSLSEPKVKMSAVYIEIYDGKELIYEIRFRPILNVVSDLD